MTIQFQPFDEHKPVQIYRRNLPHWRQEGATYFVTFRLHDALPAPAVEQLRCLRTVLLQQADNPALYLAADREYFRRMKHYLIAGHGACWLRQAELAAVVQDALLFFEGDRYQIGELAVLPNHVHALVAPRPGYPLDTILHSWKSFTARQLNRLLGRTGPVWQDESYDRLVRDSLEFQRTERYIRKNRGDEKA